MKDAIEAITNTRERIEGNFTSNTSDGLEKSIPFDKAEFEEECKEGMSVEEFRMAALKYVNSLPWKK